MSSLGADEIVSASAASGSVPARRRPRRSIWDRIPQVVSVPAFALFLVALWQLAVSLEWASELVLPAPADVATALWDMTKSLVNGEYVFDSFWVTTKEVVLGLLIAAVVGIGLGVASAETAFGRRVLQPFLVAAYAAPKVAFAPIFVAWLGFDIWPKVLMAVVIAFFPLLVDTAAGLAGQDPDQDKLFRAMRASRWQTFAKLKAYNALPFVFAGLKSAAVLAVIGAIVGEFLGGGEGLGALIRISSSQLAMDRVFALVVILSVMAYALYVLVAVLERRVVHWRKPGFMSGLDV
jgi:NitT/TauT family transport system permease protein